MFSAVANLFGYFFVNGNLQKQIIKNIAPHENMSDSGPKY